MLISSRVALVGLWAIFFAGSLLFILNQNPESKDALENWWEQVSTGNHGIYGELNESDDDATDDGANQEDDDERDAENDDNESDDESSSESAHDIVVAIHGSNYPSKSHETTGSTFEHQAHFDEGLPNGVNKYSFMPKPTEIDDLHRICYVNVGKTAGSSVACRLGFAYDLCPIDHVRIPNGNLPLYTTSMMHKDVNGCRTDSISDTFNEFHSFATYIFVIRDPLERIKTWFAYERPKTTDASSDHAYAQKKPLFVDCPFDTLDDLGGDLGLGGNNNTVCSQRAWNAILGVEAYAEHNYYNYGYYMDQVTALVNQTSTPTSAPRYVVLRTEHLEKDWRAIETQLLNGPDPFRTNFSFPTRHSPYRRPQDSILSTTSQTNVCRALCPEIQIYKRLLEQAENLDTDDYVNSIQELQESCPHEAISSHC